jgi:hypothetical protein
MIVNSPAPKKGPPSGAERREIEKWWMAEYRDKYLARSLEEHALVERPASYLLVRALRAGVPLEKLL